jgi:hypothetical protein
VLLTIRRVSDREHKAAEDALKTQEGYLEEERKRRIKAEYQLYEATLLLAKHGIELPSMREPDEPKSDEHSSEDIP